MTLPGSLILLGFFLLVNTLAISYWYLAIIFGLKINYLAIYYIVRFFLLRFFIFFALHLHSINYPFANVLLFPYNNIALLTILRTGSFFNLAKTIIFFASLILFAYILALRFYNYIAHCTCILFFLHCDFENSTSFIIALRIRYSLKLINFFLLLGFL